MVVRAENYADMENDLSEVFNLSKVDFTKLYHLIEEWIIKRKIKKIEKIYIYHLTYENLDLSVKSK